MAAIAKRLFGAIAAPTPGIFLAGFQFDLKGRLLGDY